jgi:hypothetical protein
LPLDLSHGGSPEFIGLGFLSFVTIVLIKLFCSPFLENMSIIAGLAAVTALLKSSAPSPRIQLAIRHRGCEWYGSTVNVKMCVAGASRVTLPESLLGYVYVLLFRVGLVNIDVSD